MYRQAIVRLVLCAFCVLGSLSPSRAAVSCVISSTPVAFGNYDVFNVSNTTSNGSVKYTCNGYPLGSGAITIFLNKGTSLTYTPRFMHNGANHLNYNLYLDAGFSLIWGDGTGGTSTYSATAVNGVPVTVTVFGSIPAVQDAHTGAYTDSVKATINF
ncbi:MAG TPA: spore coat U domain-containing protein [Candidatus Acidoferrales bacterium]|nr:spore coat U domain-containing protein [Candidatus Acidoferrales bacterium]